MKQYIAIDLKSFYASVECVEHERNNQSTKHKHKNNHQRAAQFAPFATLTGYDAVIDETTKLTDEKLELSDEQTEFLNQQIQLLTERLSEQPQVGITYFLPDDRKSGGEYVTVTGNVRRVDDFNREIVFTDGLTVKIDDVWNIRIM